MYSSTEIPPFALSFFLRPTYHLKLLQVFFVDVFFSLFFFLCIFFWTNFQSVPGQDELLGNRLGFNSRDHRDESQNQPSVTCSCSCVSLGKARPEGGKSCLCVTMCVCVCVCTNTYITRVEYSWVRNLFLTTMWTSAWKEVIRKINIITSEEK